MNPQTPEEMVAHAEGGDMMDYDTLQGVRGTTIIRARNAANRFYIALKQDESAFCLFIKAIRIKETCALCLLEKTGQGETNVNSSENFRLSIHLQEKARANGIPLSKILRVLENPVEVVDSGLHPGQLRYIGEGLAIMVNPVQMVAITFYLDKVVTPLRPDQIEKGVEIRRTKNSYKTY